VKNEEIDWLIYHIIARDTTTTPEYLVVQTGFDPSVVKASLLRLEHNQLIELCDKNARALSVGEFLVRCHDRYDLSLPFTVEKGVIRPKKPEQGKE
jgi:hypothetical protein